MTVATRGATSHLQWHRWEDLASHYDSIHSVAPYLSYSDNDDSKFSFDINHWLYFYVEMHRMSGQDRWLDLGRDTCQYFIDNNDEARVVRGDIILNGTVKGVDRYYQAPYPYALNGTPVAGWSANNGGNTLVVQILQDGQIIAAMSYYADYVLDNNIADYTVNAATFFAHIRRVIGSHDNSWRYDKTSVSPPITVEGNWYYPERILDNNTVYSSLLAFNHSAGACQAALLCHKHYNVPEYLAKAVAFMGFTRSNRTTVNDMWAWQYTLEYEGSEDLNHGSYSFMFFMLAYINGYLSFTDDELTKYANATVNAWQGDKVGDLSEKFDGSGVIPGGEAFDPSHFADLAKFNSLVYKITSEAHAVRSKANSNYGRMFRGASVLLRYNQLGSLL